MSRLVFNNSERATRRESSSAIPGFLGDPALKDVMTKGGVLARRKAIIAPRRLNVRVKVGSRKLGRRTMETSINGSGHVSAYDGSLAKEGASSRSQRGYALAHDEGEAFWLLGMLQTIKIGRADTDGRFGLLEIVVPAGIGPPWHVHPEEDEWFYVIDGHITFWVGESQVELTAGSFAYGPKGVPHSFMGTAPASRALVGFSPMQFEGFQREVGQPAPERVLPPVHEGPPPDIARLAQIARRNGFEILGPPGPPPGR